MTTTKTAARHIRRGLHSTIAGSDHTAVIHLVPATRAPHDDGDHLSHDQKFSATRPKVVVADQTDHGQWTSDDQLGHAVVAPIPGQAIGNTTPASVTPDLGSYRTLRVIAEMLWDAQKTRIAVANRVGRADIDPTLYTASLDVIERAEHECKLGLAKAYRKTVSPEIRAWQKETRGVGEHLLASLLGVIGHPVWTERHRWVGEGPSRELESLGVFRRRVSDLWSYCGHGDATRRRTKGMTAEDAYRLGNPRAKTIVWLLACAQLKSSGPYRAVYDDARANYQDREGWTPGHQHNAAIRLVGKEMLRDLWVVAGGSKREENQ